MRFAARSPARSSRPVRSGRRRDRRTAPKLDAGAVLEVTEIVGQPGAAVEAGGLVIRLVDVSRPLVRLDLPAELLRDGPPLSEVELGLVASRPSALRGATNRPEAATL